MTIIIVGVVIIIIVGYVKYKQAKLIIKQNIKIENKHVVVIKRKKNKVLKR